MDKKNMKVLFEFIFTNFKTQYYQRVLTPSGGHTTHRLEIIKVKKRFVAN